ncbi:hypothetical protein PIB30_022346 [Stylosanthes scabra]|uniref:Disease resistance R13L4/SHOC-2-like LRR domain-containing protein n=1 Tax=Stylosanthes scabra TaxID=79078 RepID=A0ABU6V845_9FABA|nr:hypothetical protein [Stylosanthes scabra]
MGTNTEELLNAWLSRYNCLRFLDITGSTCKVLPESIGKLKHLRCFSLRNNREIKRLSSSILMLQNLQLLYVSECPELEELPSRSDIPPDTAMLSSLEVVCIYACRKLESLFPGIKLSAQRKLHISHCEQLKSLQLDISHFPQLETLTIVDCPNLELSKIQEDENSNLKLKFLSLECLPQLVNLPLWIQRAASTLQYLRIKGCNMLEDLPEWLSHMGVLKYLDMIDCPGLYEKYKPQDGEGWHKISHVEVRVHFHC